MIQLPEPTTGITTTERFTLVQRIAGDISRDIEAGLLKKNEKLWSINNYSRQYGVARDTIEKAYILLKQEGYISAIKGKGYFVLGPQETRIRVLLLFNKLSSYKKMVYDALLHSLGSGVKVDLHIFHYDPSLLEEYIDANLHQYHYYVIMPHFYIHADTLDCLRILKKIPVNQLILLDKYHTGTKALSAVYQDFEHDIYKALQQETSRFEKYSNIVVTFPADRHHPLEILTGIKTFANEIGRKMDVVGSAHDCVLKPGSVFIVLTESDLAVLIKACRANGLTPGQEVGIISFNETVFKELLDITVITTDFEQMGKSVANLILNNKSGLIKNPFRIIPRQSF